MIRRPSEMLHTPAYDPKAYLALVQKQHADYPLNNEAICKEWTMKAMDIAFGEKIPYRIVLQVFNSIHHVMENDDVYAYFPPDTELRPWLEEKHHQYTEERLVSASARMVDYLELLARVLPESIY